MYVYRAHTKRTDIAPNKLLLTKDVSGCRAKFIETKKKKKFPLEFTPLSIIEIKSKIYVGLLTPAVRAQAKYLALNFAD